MTKLVIYLYISVSFPDFICLTFITSYNGRALCPCLELVVGCVSS